MTPLYFKSFLR